MSVTDEAIEKIKEMIVSGELAPGDRLPREADLAGALGLSRNSLREAVKALSLLNVLDVRQGDGTYVTSLEAPLLLETLSFILDLHRDDDVLQVFQVRSILEPAATGLAAQHADDEAIAELREIVAAAGEASTVTELVASDIRFHVRIAEAAGNPLLASLIESLSARSARARIWRGLTQQHAVEQTVAEHQAILDAVDAGETELARSLATVHIAGVTQWVRGAL
ncbi:FadR/GntR family transcriptional regulator [Streptacidiphilus monticola]|uniref:FadR/GntR family transcriptional regulator n=1 Tax=Streptacidiphilus monticola TaxID=2161674 RepID=A0ABW1G6R3_9ACTN